MVGLTLGVNANEASRLWQNESMAYGRLIELNRFTPKVDKNLLLRLYETPKAGESCRVESGAVCKYKYLLTVSTMDEYPEVKVQPLVLEGQFISAEWKATTESNQQLQGDEAHLLITYSVFAMQASKINPKLGKEHRTVKLHVDLKEIKEQFKE